MEHKGLIQRGIDYIEDNLRGEINALELAHSAGFSLWHYYRIFLNATGFPVMQYILRRRHYMGCTKSAKASAASMLRWNTGLIHTPGFIRLSAESSV